jgi:ketosteroid isomerase-like protein
LIEKAFVATKTSDPVEKYIDPDIVIYDLMPPTFNGIAAWRGQMAGLAAAFKNFKIEILKIDVRADRELAVANSEQHFTVLDEKGVAITESTYWVTDCYHKVNGHWLLFSMHESYPVDLATGKVVLNAK